MVISRIDWKLHGDLLAWIATEYPGLPPEAFEAAYRLLSDPDLSERAGEDVERMLTLVQDAMSATTLPRAGPGGGGLTSDTFGTDTTTDGDHASVDTDEEE
jgi:hypothetical protein